MNIKYFLKIFLIVQLCLLITGCEKKMKDSDIIISDEQINSSNSPVDEESQWYDSYNLDCDKIIFAVANNKKDKPRTEFKHILEIIDEQKIEDIKNTINISSWEQVSSENRAKGIPYFYIIIGEDTIISMYSDIAYGGIANYTVNDGLYDITDYSGDYLLSDELFKKVWEYVKPYQDELDVEPYEEN